MQRLNEKQTKIYRYLREAAQSGIMPTVREICAATGIKSTSTVHAHLKALEELGYIDRKDGLKRYIRLSGAQKTAQVPILGRITAGEPILAIEEIEGSIPFAAGESRPEDLFALHVSGDSMIGAGILNGDYIVAERDKPVENGDIVVALIDDEATVKRFFREEDGRIRLQPENPAYEPILRENVQVLGKVRAIIRYY